MKVCFFFKINDKKKRTKIKNFKFSGPEKPGIWTIFSVCSVIKPITKYTGKNTLNDGKDQKKALQREQTPTSGNLLMSLSW